MTGTAYRRRAALAAVLSTTTMAQAAAPASTAPPSPGALPGLGSLGRLAGFTYGCAVRSDRLAEDPPYAGDVARECAVMVPEWEAKFETLQPEEGKFDFGLLDEVLTFAQAKGIAVRGHALVWHAALPPWAREAIASGADRARGVMDAHFETVLNRTRPRIRDWDVVNEVVADPPGSDTPDGGPGPLRATPMLTALGPGYIDLAFRKAREIDPTLRLTLNEYGIEEDTPSADEKRQRLLGLLRGLRDRDVPIDAVGIQGHLQMRNAFSAEKFTAFVRAIRALGLSVLITELDVREDWRVPEGYPARDDVVAARVRDFLASAVDGGVRTVLTWGLVDRYSWLVTDPDVARKDGLHHRGLPLDWEGSRKAMWRAMAQVIGGQS
ncbi:endo-1,4-beta-xylanase [Humitalea rosea]|uniref:Beta-xylanase n=1 Tax=Humitalea rosea TaxID=990373 RepID=A0A2W7ISY1_9PROT|nr:endo-1,4-beta-xylanase [Humitalea rosea]PZW50359.1 endo-1,4-beta-xylanase [Humitalea rosea]